MTNKLLLGAGLISILSGCVIQEGESNAGFDVDGFLSMPVNQLKTRDNCQYDAYSNQCRTNSFRWRYIENEDTLDVNMTYISLGFAGELIGIMEEIRPSTLMISSNGGSYSESIAIAEAVRSLGMNTRLKAGEECASSCVVILAAGLERIGVTDGKSSGTADGMIGVHKSSSPDGEYDGLVCEYVRHLTGSEENLFCDLVTSVPYNSVAWIATSAAYFDKESELITSTNNTPYNPYAGLFGGTTYRWNTVEFSDE